MTIVQYLYKPRIKINCEYAPTLKNVNDDIISRLSKSLNIVKVRTDEQFDVKVVFCPIVSRLGTDITGAVSRLTSDEPSIVFVLHHTYDAEYKTPNSSRYERRNLMIVDMLFHEDWGLLNCSKNYDAISKAENYLRKYAKQFTVCFKNVITVVAVFGAFWTMWKIVQFFGRPGLFL